MSLFSKLRSKVGSIFKRKPKAPKVRARKYGAHGIQRGPGHRGIAAGSLKKRQRLQAQGKHPYTAAEIAKWETLSGDVIEAFIYDAKVLPVHSTNVRAFQYLIETEQMFVEYKGGGTYLYQNVTEDEANSIAYAQSKGAAVWDLFRIRGTKYGHRKPYQKSSMRYYLTARKGR